MARKRKSDATPLDEVDRTLYTTFCSAANSLSQLYTHVMNHQKVAFQAGERQALEKLYQWIIRQHEEGSRVTAADIVAYIENEIDYGGDDAAISPRLHYQHQFPQSTPHLPNSGIQNTPGFVGQPAHGIPPRTSHSEQVMVGNLILQAITILPWKCTEVACFAASLIYEWNKLSLRVIMINISISYSRAPVIMTNIKAGILKYYSEKVPCTLCYFMKCFK